MVAAPAAMPVKPKAPAISAMMKKKRAHFSMVSRSIVLLPAG